MNPQPFTPDLLASNEEAAKQFLEIYQVKSYGCLDDWKAMNLEELKQYAVSKLLEVQDYLHITEFLKTRNELH